MACAAAAEPELPVPPVETRQPARNGPRLRRNLWRLLGFALDAFTIATSVADIVTDVLVLLEFRGLGYETFFAASAAVFALAQLSYAFLFAASFAAHRNPRARVVVFVLVLPMAQLVPLFTWLEALRLPAVDRWLWRVGLSPTAGPEAQMAADTGDSLWVLVQSRYQSHAGFLVEAFVEAVPQAVLQAVFVVSERRATALNVVSVTMSVFTIASKGYLVSYALDLATFTFNFLCIIADCVGLFACATIVALHPEAFAAQAFARLGICGLFLSVVAGHGVLWFAVFDDHLKQRDRVRWPGGVQGVKTVFFDLYIVRVSAWCLAIVPCAVLFSGARLALLPICVLRSIDPDLVRHARFFRGLAHFLHGRGGGAPGLDARLWTANSFLARARPRANELEQRARCAPREHRATSIQRWAEQVGVPSATSEVWARVRKQRGETTEDAALQKVILDSFAHAAACGDSAGVSVGALLRAQLRRSRLLAWLEDAARGVVRELRGRSEVLRALSEGTDAPTDPCRRPSSLALTDPRRRPSTLALRALAVAALTTVALCAVPLGLCHATFVLVGTVLPLLHVGPACAECSFQLSCGLSASYAVSILLLVVLAPLVARRNVVWAELPDLRGFPEAFYGGAVLTEIRRRHLRDSVLRSRLGYRLTQYTLAFLEEELAPPSHPAGGRRK